MCACTSTWALFFFGPDANSCDNVYVNKDLSCQVLHPIVWQGPWGVCWVHAGESTCALTCMREKNETMRIVTVWFSSDRYKTSRTEWFDENERTESIMVLWWCPHLRRAHGYFAASAASPSASAVSHTVLGWTPPLIAWTSRDQQRVDWSAVCIITFWKFLIDYTLNWGFKDRWWIIKECKWLVLQGRSAEEPFEMHVQIQITNTKSSFGASCASSRQAWPLQAEETGRRKPIFSPSENQRDVWKNRVIAFRRMGEFSQCEQK